MTYSLKQLLRASKVPKTAVDGKEVNVIPPLPYKEGYEFVGWYKDLEGKDPWDFANDIIPKKEYDEVGNYIHKETKIYAMWR